MRAPARQRGFLLIAAVVIIVVAGVMALVIVTLVAGASRAGTQHLQSAQAFFIAESGLERGIYRWKLDNAYAGEGPVSFGGGTYTITAFDTDSSGAPLPTGKKRLRSAGAIGTVPPAARTLELVGSRHFFAEQFPDAGDFTDEWTMTLTGAGTSDFDAANCPAVTCPSSLAGSGSMVARTNAGGPNDRLTGYAERELTTKIETDAGLNVDVEVGYQKTAGNSPRVSDISVTLIDSMAGVETTAWSNADPTTVGWVLGTASAVSLPAGRTYDRIRLRFDLHERGNNQVSAYFDEIRIKPAGGGVLREAWREVFP